MQSANTQLSNVSVSKQASWSRRRASDWCKRHSVESSLNFVQSQLTVQKGI